MLQSKEFIDYNHQDSLLKQILKWSSSEGMMQLIVNIIFEPYNGSYMTATVFFRESRVLIK